MMDHRDSEVGTKTNRRSLAWVAAAIGSLLLIGIVAVVAVVLRSGPSKEQDEWIQKIARFRYPPSAKVRDAGFIGMQGWTADTSFTMLSSDLDTFVASTPLKTPLANYGLPTGICKYKLNEETPHLFGTFYEEEGLLHYTRLTVYIDVSNPDLYLVYVCAAGD